MTNTDRNRAFLLDLEALTRKHGVAIIGCGCCGSPSLTSADTSDERSGYASLADNMEDEIQWVCPLDEYNWKRFASKIVKVQP